MFCCALCRSSEIDEVNYGEVLGQELQVHTFCLYLSSNLCQAGQEDEGLLGFLLDDIIKESKRISKLYCCYCSKSYANIGCCNTKCRRTFHLICGIKNGAENQFVDTYNSYCNLHVRNKTGRVPNRDVKCCICYDNLRKPHQKFDAVKMIRAPCCQNGWFHKMCLQKFAKTAGYFFKCPLCNDSEIFCAMLPYRGVFIYNRDAAWELEPNAFADQLERPNSCAAKKCKCYNSRQKTTKRNPLLLCKGCGSIAMHKQCLPDLIRSNHFYCNDCNIVQEINCERNNLRIKHRNESYDEDDDVDVCNDSDENGSLDTRKTTIIIASSNEEIIFREGGVQRINFISDDDDNGDELTECSNKPWIPRRKTKVNKILDDDSDVENNTKCKNEKLYHNYAGNANNEECIADCYEKAQSSSNKNASLSIYNIRSNSLENSHISLEPKHIKITISSDDEDEDCLAIPKSSKVSKRRKIFDESINITNDSNCSSDDFPNFRPDKLCDKKPISVTGTVKSRNKSLQNVTNDIGPCNSSSMNNTSCIANRTRRKSIYMDSDSVNADLPSFFPERHTTSIKTQKSVQSISNTASRSSINSSCIANRTRRKSLYKESDTVKSAAVSSFPTSERVDSMTTTCIAQRTRRKSICFQIQSSNQSPESYATNLIYPNIMRSEPCVNQAKIKTEKTNALTHENHNSDMHPLHATSTARRSHMCQYINPSTADVKDRAPNQTVVTISDISSEDAQFQSFSRSSSTSSYKSVYSSMLENGTSKSSKSNACIKKNRVKVLVKRVRNSSAFKELTSSKYSRLLSTDNENYVKPKCNASENRLQRNFRIENSKCPMRAKHNNIMPYLTPEFQRIDGRLKKDNNYNVIELLD